MCISRRGPVVALTVFALLLVPTQVFAEIVTVRIDGEVTSIRDSKNILGDSIHVGDATSAIYIYDTLSDDMDPGPDACFESTQILSGISFEIGDLTFQTNPDNWNLVVDIGHYLRHDGRSHNMMNISSDVDPPLYEVAKLELCFASPVSYDTDYLPSYGLPTTAPDMEYWNGTFAILADGYTIRGCITSTVLVPEPTTVVLLALGGLAMLRRRLN